MYAVYHGPEGLKGIAARAHQMAVALADAFRAAGLSIAETHFFDTLRLPIAGPKQAEIRSAAENSSWIAARCEFHLVVDPVKKFADFVPSDQVGLDQVLR